MTDGKLTFHFIIDSIEVNYSSLVGIGYKKLFKKSTFDKKTDRSNSRRSDRDSKADFLAI